MQQGSLGSLSSIKYSLPLLQHAPFDGYPLTLAEDAAQGLMVQPGWQEVLPCKATVVQLYSALEMGTWDLPLTLSAGGCGTFTSLRALASVPLQQQVTMFGNASFGIVNAMHLKLCDGDPCDLAVMKLVGELQA